MVGGMAEITIKPGSQKGDYSIETGIRPLVCHLSDDEVSVYFLDDYTEKLAEENLIRRQDPDFSLENCNKLVDQVWGDK